MSYRTVSGKRHMDKSPSPIAKRLKFSDVMKDLETELSEKLENLDKGDLAWINRARSGRIVKWPILVSLFTIKYFSSF